MTYKIDLQIRDLTAVDGNSKICSSMTDYLTTNSSKSSSTSVNNELCASNIPPTQIINYSEDVLPTLNQQNDLVSALESCESVDQYSFPISNNQPCPFPMNGIWPTSYMPASYLQINSPELPPFNMSIPNHPYPTFPMFQHEVKMINLPVDPYYAIGSPMRVLDIPFIFNQKENINPYIFDMNISSNLMHNSLNQPLFTMQMEDYSQQFKDGSKPPYSYASLIAQAILSSETKKLTLSSIYEWIISKYPYFKNQVNGWQNSIRHNLSLNKCFIKIPRGDSDAGKGAFWGIDHSSLIYFENGYMRKRRARQIEERMESNIPSTPNSETTSSSTLFSSTSVLQTYNYASELVTNNHASQVNCKQNHLSVNSSNDPIITNSRSKKKTLLATQKKPKRRASVSNIEKDHLSIINSNSNNSHTSLFNSKQFNIIPPQDFDQLSNSSKENPHLYFNSPPLSSSSPRKMSCPAIFSLRDEQKHFSPNSSTSSLLDYWQPFLHSHNQTLKPQERSPVFNSHSHYSLSDMLHSTDPSMLLSFDPVGIESFPFHHPQLE